jgi:hypothetical protein
MSQEAGRRHRATLWRVAQMWGLTSALSERLGLARLSLGRPESPLVSVGKPCAVLHSFVVLPKLVSPARPLPLPPAAACGLW